MKAVCAGVVVLVVLVFLAPALAMVWDSWRGPDGFSAAAYAHVLREPRQWTLLGRSMLVAAGATALALCWGVPVGYTIARTRGALAACVETLAYVPLLLPSLVIAMGWVFILGRAGVVTAWLQSRLGRSPVDLYTPAGAAFVLSLCTFPCVAILAAQGFRSVDPAGIRAARLVAGRWRVLWCVWRPLLAPGLATGALLAFLLAFADFGVPSALMVNVYPIEVFTEFSAYFDVKRAIASSAAPVGLVALLFCARLACAGGSPKPASGRGTAAPAAPPARWVVALAMLALGLAVALPVGFLLVTARGAYAEALRTAGEQVLTSLQVALLGAAFAVPAGLLFALAYRGLGRRGRAAAEGLALVPLLVPGTAVGLGILWLVTAGAWPFAAMYPDAAIVAYAGAARCVPFPALLLAAAVASLHVRGLQAATVHGATRARVAFGIVTPLLWPALAAATTASFLLCLGELPASVLVNPPGTMTLPVRLASLLHFGKDSLVASLCLMLTALVLAVLVLGALLVGRPIRLRLPHADRTP